jgi:hypothetical protein
LVSVADIDALVKELAAPPCGRCCGTTYEADWKLKHSKRKKAGGVYKGCVLREPLSP